MKPTRQPYLMFALLLAFAPYLLAAPSGNLISYQGRVVDANGVPLADGNYSAAFRLYVDGAPTSFLETLTVAVRNGVFTAYLGGTSALPVFETTREYQLGVKVGAGAEVKQAITSVPLARTASSANTAATVSDGAVTTAKLADGAVTTAKLGNSSVADAKLAAGLAIPIGGIIMYWGNSASLPAGFELCDGANVSTAGSSLLGQPKPNLVNKFVRGTTGDVKTTAVTGGADSAVHSHKVDSHTHSVSSSLGTHSHEYKLRYRPRYGALTGNDADAIQVTNSSGSFYNSNYAGTWRVPKNNGLQEGASDSDTAQYDAVGTTTNNPNLSHNHGGATGAASPDTDSKTISTVPAYVGLLFIMRVL